MFFVASTVCLVACGVALILGMDSATRVGDTSGTVGRKGNHPKSVTPCIV